MAEFAIYQSEAGVRSENMLLKRELEMLRNENARLREKAGEPALVMAAAIVRPPAQGETFKAGNCAVSINGAAGAGAAPVIPRAVASKRPAAAARVARPAMARAAASPGAVLSFAMNGEVSTHTGTTGGTPPVMAAIAGTGVAGDVNEVEDEAMMRFAMVELR